VAREIITVDGEIVPDVAGGESLAVRLNRAEIDQQVTTSRSYPRSLPAVMDAMTSIAAKNRETAATMLYVLPKRSKEADAKEISGPSIRYAEALQAFYGNCRVSSRVVEVNRVEKYVEAEAVFHDLQSNSSNVARVRRRISTKEGRVYGDDMIVVTGNAACSIAKRNAILAGIPRAVWGSAYESAVKLVAGDPKEAAKRLEVAIKWFKGQGADEKVLLAAIGLEDKAKVQPAHIATLEGMAATLKNGEATLEELLKGATAASGHEVVQNPLEDAPTEPAKEAKAGGKKQQPAKDEVL
jgi:hypothetical protein